MWKLSSQNTGGHLYKHDPKPTTLLQLELCRQGKCSNYCLHLRSLPLSEGFLSYLILFLLEKWQKWAGRDTSHRAKLRWPCLSGGVGAGAAPVAAAARGTGSPAHGGPAPRGTRPSPHPWGWPAPHGRWWQHSPGRAESPGGWPRPGGQHNSGSDLLAIDVSSIHMLQRLLGLIWILKLHICIAFSQMGVHPFYRYVNHFNFPVGGEYLHDMILGHIPGEPSNVHFGGFRGRAPPFPFLSVSFGWFRFGARTPLVVLPALRRTRRARGAAGAGAAGCAGTSWAARCWRWAGAAAGAHAGAGARAGGRAGPRPGAAATTGSAAPLSSFIPATILLAWLLCGPLIFRAILGLLIRAVFAFGRRRSPSAGLFIIFFDS